MLIVWILLFVEFISARAKKFKGDEKMPNSKLHLVRFYKLVEGLC